MPWCEYHMKFKVLRDYVATFTTVAVVVSLILGYDPVEMVLGLQDAGATSNGTFYLGFKLFG